MPLTRGIQQLPTVTIKIMNLRRKFLNIRNPSRFLWIWIVYKLLITEIPFLSPTELQFWTNHHRVLILNHVVSYGTFYLICVKITPYSSQPIIWKRLKRWLIKLPLYRTVNCYAMVHRFNWNGALKRVTFWKYWPVINFDKLKRSMPFKNLCPTWSWNRLSSRHWSFHCRTNTKRHSPSCWASWKDVNMIWAYHR